MKNNDGISNLNERRRKSSGKSVKEAIKMAKLKRIYGQNKDRSVSH